MPPHTQKPLLTVRMSATIPTCSRLQFTMRLPEIWTELSAAIPQTAAEPRFQRGLQSGERAIMVSKPNGAMTMRRDTSPSLLQQKTLSALGRWIQKRCLPAVHRFPVWVRLLMAESSQTSWHLVIAVLLTPTQLWRLIMGLRTSPPKVTPAVAALPWPLRW